MELIMNGPLSCHVPQVVRCCRNSNSIFSHNRTQWHRSYGVSCICIHHSSHVPWRGLV